MELGPGITGTKKVSWTEKNPRALFERVVRENKAMKAEARLSIFWELVREDQDYLYAIVAKFFTDTERAWLMESHDKKKQAAETAAKIAAEQKNLEVKLGKLLLMQYPTPANKPLGNCTGRECLSFGGWYINVGRKVGQKSLVKDKLDEDQLRQIWKSKT